MAFEVYGAEPYTKAMNEYAELIQLDSENMLPSWSEVKARMDEQAQKAQEAQQAEQQMQAQNEQMEAQIAERKIAVIEDDQRRKKAETVSRIEGEVNKRVDEGEFEEAPMGQ